jgi:hypothetical protein
MHNEEGKIRGAGSRGIFAKVLTDPKSPLVTIY